MSEQSCDAIFSALACRYSNVGVSIIDSFDDLKILVLLKPDLVFLGMKFLSQTSDSVTGAPNKLWISDFLDSHGITYTGSNKIAQNLEQHKSLAKQRVIRAGLKTSPYWVISKDHTQNINTTSLKFPLFIKPLDMGGGKGIDSYSVVRNITELNSKVRSIAVGLKADVIIEEYLTGREFSVAILKQEFSDEFDVMPIEIIAPKDEFGQRILSRDVKLKDSEKSFLILDKEIQSKVCVFAMDVFSALGAREYGRIDIRLDGSNNPYFLEANLIPSLKRSIGNYFPKSCLKNIGMDYDQMILRIVRLAFDRSNTQVKKVQVEKMFAETEAIFHS